jgi:peptide/nickel transport system substrate-binding protein
MRDKVRAGEVELVFGSWGSSSIGDVAAITPNFFSGGPDDMARDDKVKEWLDQGDNAGDPSIRKDFYKKALQYIADNVYWLPMWSHSTNYAFSKEVDFTPFADEIARFYLVKWN